MTGSMGEQPFDLTKMERMNLDSTILDCLFDVEAETYDEDELREIKEQVHVISMRITTNIEKIAAARAQDLRAAYDKACEQVDMEMDARVDAEHALRQIKKIVKEALL